MRISADSISNRNIGRVTCDQKQSMKTAEKLYLGIYIWCEIYFLFLIMGLKSTNIHLYMRKEIYAHAVCVS